MTAVTAPAVADPVPARWRRPAAVVLWPLATGALAHLTLSSATGPARDLGIFWRAGGSLAAGGPLYDPEREFIYPPVAGWLFAPLGLLPFRAAVVVVVVLSVVTVVVSTLMLLRLVGVPATSPVAAGALLLVATSRPVTGLLYQGNVDVLLLLAEVGVIVLLLSGRQWWAGALLGAVCAVKPILAPVLLALLLIGRVPAVVAAGVVGLALTVVGWVTVPDRDVFVAEVLPLLAGGNREVLAPYNRSLAGAAEQLGIPPWGSIALRLAAVGAVCWVVWRRRRHRLAPLEAVPLAMLAAVIASSFSWANHSIYLLPLLVTVARPDSLVRSWPAWAGVYLFATTDAWHVPGLAGAPDAVLRLVPLWGWLLLLGACVTAQARRRGAREPGMALLRSGGRSGARPRLSEGDPGADPQGTADRVGAYRAERE